jgi:hypothetical protein
VEAIAGPDPLAAVRALVARRGDATFVVVLRHDEQDAWPAPLPVADFELLTVLPGPREGRDDSLYVYRLRS